MNILIDGCPDAIEIDGEIYNINSDHRTSMLFELAMVDDELNDNQKVQVALDLYYNETPSNHEQALQAILWFHSGGIDNGEVNEEQENLNKCEHKPQQKEMYSLDYDSEYIFSSFLIAYGIDLSEETLHWWKFMALFNTLPEDTIIKKIINIRAREITPDMSKEEKKRAIELKRIYALPNKINDKDEAGEAFGDALGGLF